LLFIAISLPAN